MNFIKSLNDWFCVYLISAAVLTVILAIICGTLISAESAESAVGYSFLIALLAPTMLQKHQKKIYEKLIARPAPTKLITWILLLFLGIPLLTGALNVLWDTREELIGKEYLATLEEYEEKLENKDYAWLVRNNLPRKPNPEHSVEAKSEYDELVALDKVFREDAENQAALKQQKLAYENEKIEQQKQKELNFVEAAKNAETIGQIKESISQLKSINEDSQNYDEAAKVLASLDTKLTELENDAAIESLKKAEEAASQKNWSQAVSLAGSVAERTSSYSKAQTLKAKYQKEFEKEQKRNFKGKWSSSTDVSKMDDTKSVYLSLDAENVIQGWLKSNRPTLWIRCLENSTDIVFSTGMSSSVEYGTSLHTVEIRIDKRKPFRQKWSDSTNNESLFASSPISLAKQIASADTLLIRFTPFNGNPQTAEFDVRGLYNHLGKVADACKWNYKSPY